MHAAFSNLHYEIEDQVAEGDKVATRYTATSKHTGTYMGIPPTDVEGIVRGRSLVRIEDGKIIEAWNNIDALGMMQQLGVMPVTEENPVYTWHESREEGSVEVNNLEANKLLLSRLYEEIWNQGKLDVVDEIYPSDMNTQLTPGGREGFKQYVAGMRSIFPDIHYTIENQIAEDDMVITRFTATGTHMAELMGIPAMFGKLVPFYWFPSTLSSILFQTK